MAHFAEINEQNIVLRVIVAEQDFIDSGVLGDPKNWIQTSYNTHGGVHKLGGTPLRMNYAGAGYRYDPERDAFIPPSPYPSWKLNENTCQWVAPKPIPEGCRFCGWNEDTQEWFDALDPQLQEARNLAESVLDDRDIHASD